ncbi:uncharacterized protein LOC126907232 [Daktulosphaira vitifoliae]|uniref:uncharacterized protein LOC126907232 n=1 Tax=Daktulosphaira vitifoliae TaxID=58002 RepID=UPI0021A97841|nr:uncharacterized protein LOC126907232 [Daktulosphaira vitifoliae]
MTYHLTQVMSNHDCFNEYLNGICKAALSQVDHCRDCLEEADNALHKLFRFTSYSIISINIKDSITVVSTCLFLSIFWFICEICPICEASYASKQNEEFSFWLNYCPEPEWPADHPLPLPKWGNSKPVFTISTLKEYEELIKKLENELQLFLISKTYDSVTNFIWFYNHYKSKMEDQSFDKFFREYEPILNDNANNCVGLSLLLIGKLAKLDVFFPGIRECLYLVSCEKNLKNFEKYNNDNPIQWITIKEHVLICLQIKIFERKGVLLLDPGYSIARVITVMNDKLSPHTGYFPLFLNSRKSFLFEMDISGRYVEWLIYNKNKIKEKNLIHIEAPYLSPISVTERRNLVDNDKCLYTVNERGQFLAKVYLDVNKPIFHLAYYDYCNDNLVNEKEIEVSYKTFLSNKKISKKVEKVLQQLSEKFNLTKMEFITILKTLSNIMNDKEFLKYREITNSYIYRIANWN